MHVFIVYAHPSKKSYTFKILQHVVDELTRNNHTITVSDLYDMEFRSDMTEQEYVREQYGNSEVPLSHDVTSEQQKIENADCIIFLYPVWWSDCPAKLKGWFDRVFTAGYAYGYDEHRNKIKKMKTLKAGHVICTAGYANDYLTEIGIAEGMNTIMLHDRLGDRFQQKEMTILGGTLNMENVQQEHSTKIVEIIQRIQSFCA